MIFSYLYIYYKGVGWDGCCHLQYEGDDRNQDVCKPYPTKVLNWTVHWLGDPQSSDWRYVGHCLEGPLVHHELWIWTNWVNNTNARGPTGHSPVGRRVNGQISCWLRQITLMFHMVLVFWQQISLVSTILPFCLTNNDILTKRNETKTNGVLRSYFWWLTWRKEFYSPAL